MICENMEQDDAVSNVGTHTHHTFIQVSVSLSLLGIALQSRATVDLPCFPRRDGNIVSAGKLRRGCVKRG